MNFKVLASMVAAWLFFISIDFVWAGEVVQLRLLYVNDFHGFAEPYQPSGSPGKLGGIAPLAGEVNRLRKERPTLLLAAGDMIQGNPWTNLFQGKSTIEVMNAMDFTAMVPGNHEFDFGQEVLKQRIREARFPLLAANVQGRPGLFYPYVLKEVSGLTIAIIGLITEETPITTHPKNVKGLTFSPVIEASQKVIRELGDKPDLVIALSHQGLPADIRLAQETSGIQIIIGGHTHTRIESPMKVKETLIVQAWEQAKVLGVLDLTIQDRKIIHYEGRLIPIRPDLQQPDPAVMEIVDRYKMETAAILQEVIGEAQVDLKGTGSRSQETNLGNWVADILRQETGADVALINGGSLRADILRGPIRIKDLFNILPFFNHPVVLKVSGRELKDIVEYGLSGQIGTGGRFPQVSGMQVSYNPSAREGRRITSFLVGEKKWDPQGWYSLATNDFLAAGGDGYDLLKRIMGEKDGDSSHLASRVVLFDSGREIRAMVIDYLKNKKRISASVEGRIQKE
ncbi:MAG: 5'-nucleotidase C-terminal domain-containing protein [Deltaproteobacteria bacterium]|nr:5'-nucleotidase C-terminal domain-containing protein [Deltaproteobacteria bacterium]